MANVLILETQQVEGSIYLYGFIHEAYQDVLLRLQASIASYIQSPGDISFDKYRAFKTMTRDGEEPFRFVDGQVIEQFLDCSAEAQEKIVEMVEWKDVETVKGLVEALRRVH